MPTRPHTNTCNSVLCALENMRDLDSVELARQPADVQYASEALIGWKRGEELSDITATWILEPARQWADVYTLDGTAECDCDAKYVHVIARRWHRGHHTTAPARVITRINADTYVVEFLTDGPGQKRQGTMRAAMGVALDDIAFLEAMEVDYGPLQGA